MKRKRTQAGNALVELAICSAVIVPLFAGTFEFGYGFYNYNRVVAAVRTGARYASLRKLDNSDQAAFQTAVKNMVVYGNPAGGTTPVVNGLTTSQVDVTPTPSGAPPDTVTVKLNTWTLNTLFKTFTFPNKPAVTFRYTGIYIP
jgi:Flp pilus assembly protein TadG